MAMKLLLPLLFLLTVHAHQHQLDVTDLDFFHMINRGHVLKLELNDTLKITLHENPSTGYSWLFETPTDRNDADPLYEIEKSEFIKGEEYLEDGAGGVREVTIRINRVGKDFLQMIYIQPWLFKGFNPEITSNDNHFYVRLEFEGV